MKKRFTVILASAMVLGVSSPGVASAALSAGSGPRADCPNAKDGSPVRARDGSGQRANRNGAKAGARKRAGAKNGTGSQARTNTPRGDCDGTGPHGSGRSAS